MELDYILMRKNDPITMATFDEFGNMLGYAKNIKNYELAPLQDRYQLDWLKKWWAERSIPIGQGQIQKYLETKGYRMPEEYLVKNLGLSLTDYYWLKPLDSGLKWEDVNLFDNPFTDNLLVYNPEHETDTIPHFSPNGSLQGTIEKTWAVMDGERYMLKGNKSNLSAESINEVIACEIHKRQKYDNYTEYKLITISGRPYDYGCCSKLFTSQKKELLSAFSIYTMEKKTNSVSHYDHFLTMAKKIGADINRLRKDLEYQILTDFVMTGYDRHLNNIALIRDADTLEITGAAPIYDSGGAFFANKAMPKNINELLKVETYGFCARETSLLKLVTDPFLIDLDKLPPASYIREMYGKDSQADESRINKIAHWYEKKIDLCREFQLGKDLSKITVPFGTQVSLKQGGQ